MPRYHPRMDSITHLFYGGAIAATIAPKSHRRAALLAGAALNTLPDLDVIPLALFGDPVAQMTCHRGLTHSWLVLPFVAWAIWAFFKRRGGRVANAPVRWWWAIFACLMAHPFLDSFTVYGTQLFWPLPMRPLMWSSLFIIDPLFTLPWLLACVVAWSARERLAANALAAGIALGAAYLGWSLLAKWQVERASAPALAALGLANAPRVSVPTPLNTLLWRVVAITPDGYVEGFRSLAADSGPMSFRFHPSDTLALAQAGGLPVVRRLAWFNHGLQKAGVCDGVLEFIDLRMGSELDYFFCFEVVWRGVSGWQAMPPRQARMPRSFAAAWDATWQRIWREPAPAPRSLDEDSGVLPAIRATK